MSLYIDASQITRVLIAGGWFEVADLDGQPVGPDGTSSFDVDSYEIADDASQDNPYMILRGGAEKLLPSHGFTFKTVDGRHLYGPLTAIQAVETSGRRRRVQ